MKRFRLELRFEGQPPQFKSFAYGNPPVGQRYSQQPHRGAGLALLLLLVEYRAWVIDGQKGKFVFAGEPINSAVASLGDAIEKPERWLNSLFVPESGASSVKVILENDRNRSGESDLEDRRIGVNSAFLAPENLVIFWNEEEVTDLSRAKQLHSALSRRSNWTHSPRFLFCTRGLKGKLKRSQNAANCDSASAARLANLGPAYLKMKVSPEATTPFRHIHDASPWFGKGHKERSEREMELQTQPGWMPQLLTLAPPLEDYLTESLPEQEVLPNIHRLLGQHGICFLTGPRGVGKSVLCLQVALSKGFAGKPAYYLNIADAPLFSDINRVATRLRSLSASGILFVLDNAHSNLEVTFRMLESWRMANRGSTLLVTARCFPPTLEKNFGDAARHCVEVLPSLDFFGRVVRYRRVTDATDENILDWYHHLNGNMIDFVASSNYGRDPKKKPEIGPFRIDHQDNRYCSLFGTFLIAFFSIGSRSVPDYLLGPGLIADLAGVEFIQMTLQKAGRAFYSIVHTTLAKHLLDQLGDYDRLYSDILAKTGGKTREWDRVLGSFRSVDADKDLAISQRAALTFGETDYDFDPESQRSFTSRPKQIKPLPDFLPAELPNISPPPPS